MKALASLASIALVAVCLVAEDLGTTHKAPELAFNVPGQGQKLLSEYRGKVVAIEFIFTTCPHCQAASKVMTKFQQEFGPRGFRAIDIAVNDNADLLVENFVKDYQVGFPVGWTTRDQMLSFMGFTSTYFVVPQLAIVDRKGYIRYETPEREDENWDKLMKEEAIRQHLEELLSVGGGASLRPSSGNTRVALAKK